uniref:Uncharacterized protein n=1 Tax=Rhizophora mucronata TaxID=61149 RepID=A0A2P2JSX5_RHIMU
MDFVSKIFSSISISISEIVNTKAMLDPELEFTNVRASVRASLHPNAMALPITPFPSIGIPCVKPVNTISMP